MTSTKILALQIGGLGFAPMDESLQTLPPPRLLSLTLTGINFQGDWAPKSVISFLNAHPSIETLDIENLAMRLHPEIGTDILPNLQSIAGDVQEVAIFLAPLPSGKGRPLTSVSTKVWYEDDDEERMDLTAVGPTMRKIDLYSGYCIWKSFMEGLVGPCSGLRYLRLACVPIRGHDQGELVRAFRFDALFPILIGICPRWTSRRPWVISGTFQSSSFETGN